MIKTLKIGIFFWNFFRSSSHHYGDKKFSKKISIFIELSAHSRLQLIFLGLNTEMNVYWLDKDGFYLGCNKNVTDVFGVTNNQIIGYNNNHLLQKNIQKPIANHINRENDLVLST